MKTPVRLAIVTTHPIQYYAPWFRQIASDPEIDLKVYYLWKPGDNGVHDPEFEQDIKWDIPLLEGYASEWVKNASSQPGTHHFRGIQNPDAVKQIARWKPATILCLGYHYDTFLRLSLSRTLKHIPFLIRGDSHRLLKTCSITQYLKDTLIRIFFNRFSGALSCGKANHQYFQLMGFNSDQIYFCPHGIDTSRFTSEPSPRSNALRRQWGIRDDHNLILFAGKFIEKKRPLDLIDAFNTLKPSRCTLVFIGNGPLKSNLVAAATDNVIIKPFINQSEMPDVYQAADLLVLPSHGNSETWGLAAQEALACGTPAIVSDHCGCHLDLITPDRNGLIFKAGNISSLTDCLRNALAPETLPRWQKNANEVLETYNYQTSLQGLRTAIGL